jgi:thiol:disulfide interchange protein DsbD
VVAWATLAGVPRPLRAAPPGNQKVQAKLVADVDSIKAGEPFTAGVLLTIEPGWHVYWKNPGDSGLATSVGQWTVPDGFTVGPLQFPIPQRIEQPGNEVIYGYEKEVLLTCRITPPNNLQPGRALKFSAEVGFLVCEQICLPGKLNVSLALKSAERPAPANSELFQRWRGLFPKPAGAVPELVKDSSLAVQGGKGQASLVLAQPPRQVQWFPCPPDGAGVQDARAVTAGDRSTYTFSLAPDPGDYRNMQLLAVITDADGTRHGVELSGSAHPNGRR